MNDIASLDEHRFRVREVMKLYKYTDSPFSDEIEDNLLKLSQELDVPIDEFVTETKEFAKNFRESMGYRNGQEGC